jgi:nitrogen fixation protein NifQ
MTGYTDTIRQWATDTRRTGTLQNADGTGEVGLESSEAGKRLAVRFTLRVVLDLVTDVRYQVFGCGFSMAACAVAADMSVGYTLDDLQMINAVRIDEALQGLPAERSYCAELAVKALQAAVMSARNDRQMVPATVQSKTEHGPRVSADDLVYTTLINSPSPDHDSNEDRHLFACLLTVAVQESSDFAGSLGLANSDIVSILKRYFPAINQGFLSQSAIPAIGPSPEHSEDILSILLSHVPIEPCTHDLLTSGWLCYIIAARAARPGHLWVAMGLFERPQLTAAIRRHLPSLAEANNQKMRWKRYLFKQVCDLNGGMMCKAPNCGVCSDYALCFAEE